MGSVPPPCAGLEESLIKSIKVYKYKIGGTDCSVCLSEFEENESLRLLPKCNHAFRVPCIDTWLIVHFADPKIVSNDQFQGKKFSGTGIKNVILHAGWFRPGIPAAAARVDGMNTYQQRSNETVLVVVQDFDMLGAEEEVISFSRNSRKL